MHTEEKSPAKEPKNKKPLKIGSVIVILFLVLYIPSLFHWVYGEKIETQILMEGVVEDIVPMEALIIREEEVIAAPFSGKCVLNTQSGNKIASGEAIATLIKDSTLSALDELSKKDMEILQAKNEIAKKKEFYSEDISKIENDISQKTKSLVGFINNSNLEASQNVRRDIETLIAKKNEIIDGTGLDDEKITLLQKEKKQLEQLIEAQTKHIVAPNSGIISFNIDGLENMVSLKKVSSLKVNDIISMNKPQNLNSKIIGNSIAVEQNKSFAKLIKSLEIYYVGVIDTDKVKDFYIEDKIKENAIQEIRVGQNGKSYKVDIAFISEDENGKCVIGLRTLKGVSETAELRKVNLEIIKTSNSGLKVPVKSLFDLNESENTAKIYIANANFASVRNVKIIDKSDEFAIIDTPENESKPIRLYDKYIVSPQNIQEGQLIEK